MAALPALDVDPLPQIDLRHVFVLTDDTGILQHANRGTPDLHHGYCTDDNARALIAAVKLWALPQDAWAPAEPDLPGPNDVLVATQRYLAFLAYAFNPGRGRFRNFMQYDRSWLEEVGSEDSHARTVWGLGMAYRLAPNDGVRDLADELMDRALSAVETFPSLRPWAYALLGLDEYLLARPDHEPARRLHRALTQRLFERWQAQAADDWPWWEDSLTWGNAKLPHAMLVAAERLGRADVVDAALKALRWLLEIQRAADGHLSVVGNQGWYIRGGPRAHYDQQPIEAKALVQACLAAAGITGDTYWAVEAGRAFRWFTGHNDAGASLYNPETGGGFDGFGSGGVNANQGAESTLAYLLSVLELHLYDLARRGQSPVPAAPRADRS